MGAGLLVLCVIYQTAVTSSLAGVTLPFSDLVGKVTPVKPKPLPPSAISSLSPPREVPSKFSATWDGDDIMSNVLPSCAEGSISRKFSAPLMLTSSSRPVDMSSILDSKLPETINKKLLPPKVRSLALMPKLYKDPVKQEASSDVCMPEISLPFRYPYVSSPSELPHAFPYYSRLEELNKSLPSPSINTLPSVPLETLRRASIDSFDAVSAVTQSLPRLKSCTSFDFDLPSSTFKNTYSSNYVYPLTSLYSLPYPLHYKSMYLPRVRTPADMIPFNYEPSSYAVENFNVPGLSKTQNIIYPPFINPFTNFNSASSYFNPNKLAEFPKTYNTIPLPKISKSESLLINARSNPTLGPSKTCTTTASVACESKIISPTKISVSSFNINSNEDSPSVITRPCIKTTDKISNFGKTDLTPTLSNYMEPVNIKNTNNLLQNLKPCVEIDYVPKLIPVSGLDIFTSPRIPETSSYKQLFLPQQCVTNTPTISSPIEPITNILSSSSAFSPVTYCPPTTTHTIPTSVSYINISPPSSLSQTTSKIVSTIDDIVSNMAQNIVSTYTSCLNSAAQYTTQSKPCVNYDFKPKPVFSVTNPLPPVNILNTESSLPVMYSSDYIYSPPIESSSVLSFDGTMAASTIYESPSNQRGTVTSPSPIITTVLPPASLMSYASPQACPSYLPSPILPSYPTMYPPVFMEMPVIKVSSSNKKEKDLEKLMEVMLLAEILDDDENFDWDDLDTVLALIAVS